MFATSAGLSDSPTLAEVARALSRVPYGRPARLDPRGVIESWRGTCSTKHMLLHSIVDECWPYLGPQLWHRVYVVTPALAHARWGAEVALHVPEAGLVDVHTYLTVTLVEPAAVVDVTFPIAAWDGRSSLPLACGAGRDHPAGTDPQATKAELVARHCDPHIREPFIDALTRLA